jgi:hypothetical protein
MRPVGIVAAALILTGCYVYHPIATNAASTGKYVRAELTDAGTASMTPAIGSNAVWIEGEVQEANANGLTIALRAINRRDFGESTWNGCGSARSLVAVPRRQCRSYPPGASASSMQ